VVVPPTATSIGFGVTWTVLTLFAPTVTLAEPLTPSTVAVTFALPGPTAVAIPDVLIVSTPAFCVAHVTACPATVAPWASRANAVNVAVPPITSAAVPGDTTTVTTDALTAVDPPPSPPQARKRARARVPRPDLDGINSVGRRELLLWVSGLGSLVTAMTRFHPEPRTRDLRPRT
jgi:hypothetical protein